METKTYTTMDYSEWDDLVHQYFPMAKEYTIVADEELNNDSSWTMNNVTKKDFMEDIASEYFLTEFGRFVIGKWNTGMTHMLFEFFVWMGILPEGNFIIEVNW